MIIHSDSDQARSAIPRLSLRWVIVSAAALSFANVAGGVAAAWLGERLDLSWLSWVLRTGLGTGAALGVALALLGRAFVPWAARQPRRWMAATIAGAIVGMTAAVFIFAYNNELFGPSAVAAIEAGVVAGLLIGVFQCFALWRTSAAWVRWTAAQMLAFACAFLISHVAIAASSIWSFALAQLCGWGVYSLLIRSAVTQLRHLDPADSAPAAAAPLTGNRAL